MKYNDRRTRVKICGITTLADARFAAGAMADYLGFIFWPGSPRHVDAEQAAEIIGWIEGPECAGVFVDQSSDEVNRIAAKTGVSLVQLHGEESPACCRRIELPVIKSFRIQPGLTEAELVIMLDPYLEHVDYILFDTWDKKLMGGTGKSFDWNLISELDGMKPVILAGGLNAGNVRKAIEAAGPYAVDVSSSLETRPGVKDFDKITEFLNEVRSVNEEN